MKLNLLGQKFGRLTVFTKSITRYRGEVCWDCLCDCGIFHTVRGTYLKSGVSKSCGCWKKELRKEKLYKPDALFRHPLYAAWRGMKSRCYREKDPRYKDYGGRGITVCERWLDSFENFLADMGERPEGLTLDRKDNDGPYSPDNCKWSTRSEQQRNTRRQKKN